jgi:hypothetical protein
MTQPAGQFTPRQLVRSVPFSTPFCYVGGLGAGATDTTIFDVAIAVSDRNATGYLAPLGGAATGFFLDASVFSDQAGTLDVLFMVTKSSLAAPATGTARSVMPGGTPIVVAASTLTLVAGLRVIGSVVTVNYKNTAGVVANVEVAAIVRSQ